MITDIIWLFSQSLMITPLGLMCMKKRYLSKKKKFRFGLIAIVLFVILESSLSMARGQNTVVTTEDDPMVKLIFILSMTAAIGIGTLLMSLIKEFRKSITAKNVSMIIMLFLSFIGLIIAIQPVQETFFPETQHFDEEIKLHVTLYTWRFYYQNMPLQNQTKDVIALNSTPHQGFNFLTINSLYLVTGKTYLLNATSDENLVHSFFIYELSIRMDIVPGEYRSYKLAFTEPGVYDFRCLTYCGVGHDALSGVIKVYDEQNT